MSKRKTKERGSLQTYLRILSYLKPYLFLVVVCVTFSVAISVFHFASLGAIKPIADLLFGNGEKEIEKFLLQFGATGQNIFDFLKLHILSDKYLTLYWLIGLIVGMTIIKSCLRITQDYIGGYLTNRVKLDLSNELFAKTKKLPVAHFSEEGTSRIANYFVNDIPLIGQGLKSVFTKAVREPFKAIATIILALMINWKLSLIVLGVLPLAAFFIKYVGKKIKRNAKKTLRQQGDILSTLNESLEGMKILKAYQMEDKLQAKFEKSNEELLRYQMKVVAADVSTSPVMETFTILAGAGVLLITAQLVFEGQMSSGDFILFYSAVGALFDPLRKLADVNNRINVAAAAGDRVFHLLDLPEESQPRKNVETATASSEVKLPRLEKEICFENITFGYNPEQPILKDVSFRVQHGEKIAIVGPNGSGKSTLISLLTRFYDAQQGKILFDGVDIYDSSTKELRGQIGLVPQEPFLFSDTIEANITSFRDLSQDIFEEATKAAFLDSFVEKMTEGYKTHFGDGGTNLSGGQKHRVSLARALYKSPTVLIIDEAMANIDAESESLIRKSMEKFMEGRTSFIIAHQFTTIEKVDRILVLNQGRIEAFGKHQELIENSPTYKMLCEHQGFAPEFVHT